MLQVCRISLSEKSVADSFAAPVIPRRSSRVSFTNSVFVERDQSSLTGYTESAFNNSTEAKPKQTLTIFNVPTRGEKSVKTYQSHGAGSQNRHGMAPGLQPAMSIYGSSSVNLGGSRDDGSDGTNELDSDDTESGDAEIFDGQNLRQTFSLTNVLEAAYSELLTLSLQVLAEAWPAYEPKVTGELSDHGDGDSDDAGHISQSTGSQRSLQRQSLRDNANVPRILELVQEVWGIEAGYHHFSALFKREEIINTAIQLSGDTACGHRYIQMIVSDIVEALGEVVEGTSEDQGGTDMSDVQGASDLADRDRASDETFDDDSSAYMAAQDVPSLPFTTVPLDRSKEDTDAHALSLTDKSANEGDKVSSRIDKEEIAPVQHEPWMDNDTPAPVKTKGKKNKRKKKSARATNSRVPGSATYYDKGKGAAEEAKPLKNASTLKASDDIGSQDVSEESGPEPTVKSAYVTANIFDRLKISDVHDTSSGRRVGASAQGLQITATAQPTDKSEYNAEKGKENATCKDLHDTQTTSAPELKDPGRLTSNPISSWSDGEGELPSAQVGPAGTSRFTVNLSIGQTIQVASANAHRVPSESVSAPPGFTTEPGTFRKPLTGSIRLNSQLPTGAGNLASDSGVEGTSRGNDPAVSVPLGTHSRTRFHTGGLSQRDIREGATIERHPIKGTECVILREPLERPDYDSILFVSGYARKTASKPTRLIDFHSDSVPYYDESVVPWQTLRAIIIDHFKKFGEVAKVYVSRILGKS